MKKILSILLTAALVFSPVGNVVFHNDTTTVEAKSYKSGKKSFNRNNNTTNNNNSSNFQQNKKSNTTNNATTTTKRGFFSGGGFMRGLMIGGLAGMLFGGLFANMGFMGDLLGLFINLIAIFVVIALIRKIFSFFKNNKKDPNPWRK